jgi:hypothetical protein
MDQRPSARARSGWPPARPPARPPGMPCGLAPVRWRCASGAHPPTGAQAAPVVLAEFDGLSLAPSKKRDGDSFIALGGKKGPKTGKPAAAEAAPKKVAGTKRGKIILHADTLESFSLLKLEAPASVDDVPKLIEALKAKKAEFKVCMSLPARPLLLVPPSRKKF